MLGEYSLTEIGIFLVLIIGCLWFDLHAHKADKPISIKNATLWSCIWISLSLVFAGYIGYRFGFEKAQLFLAGYLLEESLSVDNLFVIMAIFASFSIKDEMQHRVLYYGILGALVMRLLFVALGSSLVTLFGSYALATFGIFVLWTAWKMWKEQKTKHIEVKDYSNHWSVRIARLLIPVHPQLVGHNFFIKVSEHNRAVWKATPLFLCLVVVELSDIMFAFDSIPAIIAITQEPFLIYTSNIFAILGLRSLYFLLAAAKRYLRYLETSVITILAYIGIKMLFDVAGIIHVPPLISLGVVIGCLTIGVIASLIIPTKNNSIHTHKKIYHT